MAWRLLTECYDRDFDGMTDSEWRVFCVICRHANDDTGDDCFPSTALLAKKSRLHKSTVPQQIQGLEAKGWIKTKQEPGKKRFFFVNIDRVLSCPFVGGEEPRPLCDSIPPRDSEPLCNPRPLRNPIGEGSDKSGGRGLTSQTRREHIKEQLKEQNNFSSLMTSEEAVFPKNDVTRNEITVNDVYGKQGLPSTTITATVNDVYGKGKRRLPITDKEQIKNRQEYFSRENRFGDGDADLHGGAEVHPLCDPKPLCDFGGEVYPENVGVSESDLFGGETFGTDYADQPHSPKHAENRLNPLISNGNTVAAAMGRNPADSDCKNADNPLNQKENGDAETPARTAEQKPEKAKKQKAVFCTTERPDDVDPDLWNDFITHRKAKRAPVTATVIKRMRSAATECQMTLSQAMEMTVTRGWQGFEARYVLKDRKESAGNRKLPAHKDPTIKFDDDYYNQRVDPNDIWGFLK